MDIEIYWSIIPDSKTAIGGLSSIKYCLETLRTASNDRSYFFLDLMQNMVSQRTFLNTPETTWLKSGSPTAQATAATA